MRSVVKLSCFFDTHLSKKTKILKIEHDNGNPPTPFKKGDIEGVHGTTNFSLNEISEPEVTKEQLRKEYWPFLEPQPLLSKLLMFCPLDSSTPLSIEALRTPTDKHIQGSEESTNLDLRLTN